MNGMQRILPDLSKMTYGQMRRLAARLGVNVFSSAEMNGSLAGAYDEETQSIVIDHRMTYRQKRCTLAHELVHWMHGDQICATGLMDRAEARTRRETATLLISPVEYAMVEAMYDADPACMADELDVTRQVIDDYRQILHDTIPA